MRKYLIAVVVAVVSALALTSIAQADDIQSITAKLTPKKRSKKQFKPAKIYVEILTQENEPARTSSRRAPSTRRSTSRRTRSSTTSKVPQCKGTEAQLQNTTTDQAIAGCGNKSIVSKGSKTPDRSRAREWHLGMGHRSTPAR